MTLAEQARRLNLRHDNLRRPNSSRNAGRNARRRGAPLPALILMTDEDRLPDPLPAAARLRPGSAVILRHRHSPRREVLAMKLARLCRARRLVMLVADDAGLAHRVRAQGLHLGSRALAFPVHCGSGWRRRKDWLVTAATHSWPELVLAARQGLDAALLSPVFATASHPGARTLGARRFALWSRRAAVPVYALGGVDEKTAKSLQGAGAAGIAAIGALAAAERAPKKAARTPRAG